MRFTLPRPNCVPQLHNVIVDNYLPSLSGFVEAQHENFNSLDDDEKKFEQQKKHYLYFSSWLSLLVLHGSRYAHSSTLRAFLPRLLVLLFEAETKHKTDEVLIRDATAACCCISW